MTTYPSGELAGPGTLPFPFGLPRPGPASRPRPSARERARACGRGRVGKQRQQAPGGEARAPAPALAPAPTRSARPSHDQGHPHLQQPREAAALQVLPALCEYAPAAEPGEGERRRRAAPGGFLGTTLAPPRPSRRPTRRAAGCQLGRWGAAATPRRPLAVSGRGGFSASRGAAHLPGTLSPAPQPHTAAAPLFPVGRPQGVAGAQSGSRSHSPQPRLARVDCFLSSADIWATVSALILSELKQLWLSARPAQSVQGVSIRKHRKPSVTSRWLLKKEIKRGGPEVSLGLLTYCVNLLLK